LKRLLLVAGTRPEIIKLAPVLLHVRDVLHRTADITFCLTGQHKSMAEEAMSIFGIRPDINLDIMKPNQSLSQIAQAIFGRLPEVIDQVKPDVLVVQGDTTTAAMAALSAFYMKVPVAHVEAGLRSFDLYSPYPEECNRRVIDGLATFDFCPTEAARENLRKESVPGSRIFLTGNTIVDAVRLIQERHALDNPKSIHPEIRPPFVLITAHRRESFGQGFRNLCEAIRQCAVRFP
jgi:UDP-N-acetylglucosamine 2-epimerase